MQWLVYLSAVRTLCRTQSPYVYFKSIDLLHSGSIGYSECTVLFQTMKYTCSYFYLVAIESMYRSVGLIILCTVVYRTTVDDFRNVKLPLLILDTYITGQTTKCHKMRGTQTHLRNTLFCYFEIWIQARSTSSSQSDIKCQTLR